MKAIFYGFGNRHIVQKLIAYEEMKINLRAVCRDAEKLIKIIEKESWDYERRMAFMQTTLEEICSGADYSACKTIDDMSKVYATSMLKRLGF